MIRPTLATSARTGWPAALLAALLLSACSERVAPIAELSGRTMGTSYSVKIAPAPDDARRQALATQIEARLGEINAQMSTYLADSDLMRFNAADSTDWQAVPADIVALVERAGRVSALSDGVYDITVGPLVNLWGFGSTGSRDTPPSDQEIEALLARVGYRQLHTRHAPPALRKSVTGLQIDLSSIAKGWAVDQVAALLVGQGFDNVLVEIGGEVLARGERQPGRPWRIAIEQPLEDQRVAMRVVALHDMAMATSGDYRNFFAAGGRRYSHTIDPRTGRTVQHRLASVSVFADNCTDADAWATALLALGEQRAQALADALGLRALLIVRTDQGLEQWPSAALRDTDLWSAASPPDATTLH